MNRKQTSALLKRLIDYIDRSPTPWHAVENAGSRLEKHGFLRLYERANWSLEPGCGYFVVRADGALIAWRQPHKIDGWILFGAHTDSPNLRVRPNPVISKHGYLQLGLEVYGGVLMGPWFDRGLSIAGRVALANEGKVISQLVDLKRPLGVIPNLAIHLDRDANAGRKINPQIEFPMIITLSKKNEEFDLKNLLATEIGCSRDDITAYDLCAYPVEKPEIVGLHNEFLMSARLDNLLSCCIAVEAILASKHDGVVVVLNDHEEVGSCSTSGADGPFLESTLRRISVDCNFEQIRPRSFMVSIDNAHGIHPNYACKHYEFHKPLLNGGPVVKVNANQRYATTALTQGIIEQAASSADVSLQYFSNRADLSCGSTIGPITAGRLGIDTIDIGCAQFAMHSARETCGTGDPEQLLRLLVQLTTRDLS